VGVAVPEAAAVRVAGRVAFGYVALRGLDDAETEAVWWNGLMTGFCREVGLDLRYVFGDTGVTDDGHERTAWRLLIGQLADVAGALVLVPSLDHLGGSVGAVVRMCVQATAAGAMVQPLLPSNGDRIARPE